MTKPTKKEKAELFRVTGKNAPIRVGLPGEEPKTFNTGDEFLSSEWPAPHVTIIEALNEGIIEKAEK